MDSTGELLGQRRIDHAVPLYKRLLFEGLTRSRRRVNWHSYQALKCIRDDMDRKIYQSDQQVIRDFNATGLRHTCFSVASGLLSHSTMVAVFPGIVGNCDRSGL
jgi:hypothetical protein